MLARAAAELSLDPIDDELSVRGLIAQHEGPIPSAGPGSPPAWDTARHDFVRNATEVPDSVHPSLWRQAQRNAPHGLFEVAPKLWQARGYDISNISFIEGDTGWIVIDPLTSEATARACLDLANATLGERPVRAVIYTHSHADHFGGVLGVTSAEAVANGEVRIIAPEHFLREAVFENVVAGPAMARRAAYQFGPLAADRAPDPRRLAVWARRSRPHRPACWRRPRRSPRRARSSSSTGCESCSRTPPNPRPRPR